MKLMAIGLGQCGNRLTDEFARLGLRAKHTRGLDVITNAIALDTDKNSLSSLEFIRPGSQRCIVLGESKTKHRGTGGDWETGFQVVIEDGYRAVEAIREAKGLSETDAFLVSAGTAGGTGSGGIAELIRVIKEVYSDKPVYALLTLPFEHEEEIDKRSISNTASCLESVSLLADATFLFDNQRFTSKGYNLSSNIEKANRKIVEPFFGLLCSGEEYKKRRVGAHKLDTGVLMQCLSGWTVIGYGKVNLPIITLPWDNVRNKGHRALDIALDELSLRSDIGLSKKALYLISAPREEMNLWLIEYIGDKLRSLSEDVTISYGDYPYNKGLIDVTLVFSDFKDLPRIEAYYERSSGRKTSPKPSENDFFNEVNIQSGQSST